MRLEVRLSTRQRVVGRIIVSVSSSRHPETASLFLYEFPADTTWRWKLVVAHILAASYGLGMKQCCRPKEIQLLISLS